MNNDPLTWTAPQPFWVNERGETEIHSVLSVPKILRFANDEFMNELLGTLEHNPAALRQYAVMEETWRGPGAAPERQPERWLERPTTKVLGLQRKALVRARAASVAGAPAAQSAAASPRIPLKLYQPAHQRHYLVSGSLVCQTPGLPDREVNPARQRVSFVLRRLFPKVRVPAELPLPDEGQTEKWDEYAYVLQGKAGEWRKVGAADDEGESAQLARGEERVAMFPASYDQDDGHRRRLFVGNVPVGKREVYQGASAEVNPTDVEVDVLDPRVVLFHARVLAPWKALVNVAMGAGLPGQDPDDPDALKAARHERVFSSVGRTFPDDASRPVYPDPEVLRAERSGMQISSWYLLLDLYEFLSQQLPVFWAEAQRSRPTSSREAQALFDALNGAKFPAGLSDGASFVESGGAYVAADVKDNLIEALIALARSKNDRDLLEAAPRVGTVGEAFEIPRPSSPPAKKLKDWPSFLFAFADAWFGVRTPAIPFKGRPGDYLSERIQGRIDALAGLLKDYLQAAGTAEPLKGSAPEPTLASMLPADMREAWYVMRLVYERPDCAPFHSTVVSAATRPFQMASFFDPDAPARPIRIGLPIDTSPDGLRKFDKNAVFMMSDMLCGQVDRFKGLGLVDIVLSVLPWPFHKPLSVPDKGPCGTGQMCALSIPIITLCALILLTIIVSLLEIIFHWLPFFTVCFPLPGFKGKKALGAS